MVRRTVTLAIGILLVSAAAASGATITVDAGSGDDAAPGTAGAPVRTIARAAALVTTGDTVEVRGGVYRETVTLTRKASGVTFRAAPGARPVVDGEGVRTFGIDVRGASGAVIDGFEVRDQTTTGIRIAKGEGNTVTGNVVHSIGPDSEARGIWLVQTAHNTVTRNVIYLVRKDGIRDWMSLDDRITSNRILLSHNGISFNSTTGAYAANNRMAHNQVGFVAKHVSHESVLGYWSLAQAHLSRFWHNTIEDSSETGIWLGSSDAPLDHLSVASNQLRGGGLSFVRDMPGLRGPHVKLDGNLYLRRGARPQSIYKEGWQREPAPVTDFGTYTDELGWDRHGWVGKVGAARRTAGADRGDAYGRQLGSDGVPAAPVTWSPIAMTPIDSSSTGSWATRKHLDEVADDNQTTYWMTDTAADEFVTLDLHGRQAFNTLIASVYRHYDKRNIHGYRFEVSDDGRAWRTIAEGANPDTAGSSLKYELDEPVSARYLRYTMVDTSCTSYEPRTACGEYFVVSDIAAGLLAPTRRRASTTSRGLLR